MYIVLAMFPLSCATCVRAHRSRDEHTQESLELAHISYMAFQIQMSAVKVLHTGNFLRTDFKKIEGTLNNSKIRPYCSLPKCNNALLCGIHGRMLENNG